MIKQRLVARTSNAGTFVNGGRSLDAQFITQIQSLAVDNYSGRWLLVGQEGLLIPPYTIGWVGNLYSSKLSASIVLSTPTFQNAPNTSWVNIEGEVVVSFYDDALAPSPGYSIMPSWYQYMMVTPQYHAATFRTLGDGTNFQALLSIRNNSIVGSSTVIIGVRRISVTVDTTAALLTVAPIFRWAQKGGSLNGTLLGKANSSSGLLPNSNAVVEVRGATASDGGVATAIGGTFGNTNHRQGFADRMATAAGHKNSRPIILIDYPDYPTMIAPGFGTYTVTVESAAAADNAATNSYLVDITWEEYKLQ